MSKIKIRIGFSVKFIAIVLPVCVCVQVENPSNPDYRLRSSWDYSSSNGPSTWSSTYSTCGGSNQSPIDIVPSSAKTERLDGFTQTGYDNGISGTLKNTGTSGYSLKFTISTSSTAPTITGGRLGSDTFEFAQFHWHWGSKNSQGSEHTINGKEYPAEIHFVHFNQKYGSVTSAASKSDGLAVLGFFYEVSSSDNSELSTFINQVSSLTSKRKRNLEFNSYLLDANYTKTWLEEITEDLKEAAGLDNDIDYIDQEEDHLQDDFLGRKYRYRGQHKKKNIRIQPQPEPVRQARASSVTLSSVVLSKLFPNEKLPENYYFYKGSLTTPTCDESVLWSVFDTTISISESQLTTLRTLSTSGTSLSDNYRPPQPLNGRSVYYRAVALTAAEATLAIAGQTAVVASTSILSILFAARLGLPLPLPVTNALTSISNARRDKETDLFIIDKIQALRQISNRL